MRNRARPPLRRRICGRRHIRATAVSADDEREGSADGGHAGDEPGDVVVDAAALETLEGDGQTAAGFVASAQHRQAPPVERGQGETANRTEQRAMMTELGVTPAGAGG